MFLFAALCTGVVGASMLLRTGGLLPLHTKIDDLDDAQVTGLIYSEDTDVLLVKQESSISFFNLSGEHDLHAKKLSRFPVAFDNTTKGTAAHVVNDTHFIYCDARKCK